MYEILLYSGIYGFTAEEFINRVKEVPEDADLTVRINSPGGSVFAGWGIIAALSERKGRNIAKVDGNASSMAFYMLPYFDEVIALDVTSFMIHRADAYVSSEDDQKFLDDVNANLRSKLEKRLNAETFKSVTGVSFEDIFSGEKRRDVWLSAKDAKKIGLVDKVVRLEPREAEAMQKTLVAFSSFESAEAFESSQGSDKKEEAKPNIIINEKIKKVMTKQELQAQFPDVYNSIIAEEKSRIEAILAFSDVDFEACKAMISGGSTPDVKFFAEMTRKAMAKNELNDIKSEAVETVEVDASKETEQPALEPVIEKMDDYTIKMRASAGIKEGEAK